jgi:hypothetical protein
MSLSDDSAFGFDHAVWTSSTPIVSPLGTPDPTENQDLVSPAFWSVEGTETMLCMHAVDGEYCNSWTNTLGNDQPVQTATTAWMLANVNGNCGNSLQAEQDCFWHPGRNINQDTCGDVLCETDAGENYPENMWAGASAAHSGWQPYTSVQPACPRGPAILNDASSSYGMKLRIGWTGDGAGACGAPTTSGHSHSSDGHDTAIGIGMECTGTCTSSVSTQPPTVCCRLLVTDC